MKTLFLFLFLACTLSGQNIVTHNIGRENYAQPPSELAALKIMAALDRAARLAIDSSMRDTILVEYIVYADHEGLVRLVEDVQLIRFRNAYQQHQRPIGVACRRVLLVGYYE